MYIYILYIYIECTINSVRSFMNTIVYIVALNLPTPIFAWANNKRLRYGTFLSTLLCLHELFCQGRASFYQRSHYLTILPLYTLPFTN